MERSATAANAARRRSRVTERSHNRSEGPADAEVVRQLAQIRYSSRVDTRDNHSMLSWDQWCATVLMVLRSELADTLRNIGFDDVDWAAWRCFYEAGQTPRAAVNRALERDL